MSGDLLARSHPDETIGALTRALPGLDAAGRLSLLHASLEMRPVANEALLRYVTFSLDALGMTQADAARAAVASWSVATQRVVYRWSCCMLQATALQTSELAALLASRGVAGQGGHPWDVWQDFVGYRGTVLITPRMSPTVAHELTQMQRTDWLDQPWMFGAAESTFTLDEIEEDSAPQNMDDGRRIAYSLMRQRTPWTDFFGKTYAWHPRQTLEHVRAVTVEHGFDIIEPLGFDKAPRGLERHELDEAPRALQARVVRAMARLDGQWPLDAALRFCDGGEAGPTPHFELTLSSSLKNDGSKWTIHMVPHDPEAVLATMARHSQHMSTPTVQLLLAQLWPHCARIDAGDRRARAGVGRRSVIVAAAAGGARRRPAGAGRAVRRVARAQQARAV
jgi:hypothetical protein